MSPPISTAYLTLIAILIIIVLLLALAMTYGKIIRHRRHKIEDAERTSQCSDLASVYWNNSNSNSGYRSSVRTQISTPSRVHGVRERQDAPPEMEAGLRDHPSSLVAGGGAWERVNMARRSREDNVARQREAEMREIEMERARSRGDLHPRMMVDVVIPGSRLSVPGR